MQERYCREVRGDEQEGGGGELDLQPEAEDGGVVEFEEIGRRSCHEAVRDRQQVCRLPRWFHDDRTSMGATSVRKMPCCSRW